MTPSDRADRAMIDDLVARAGLRTPDYVDDVLAATVRVRQRPPWTFAAFWLPATRRGRTALRLALVAALLGLALLGTILVGGSRPTPPPTDGPAPSAAPTPAPAASPTGPPVGAYEACAGAASSPLTLVAWDQETGVTMSDVIDSLNRQFEAANPGVAIRRQTQAADELAASVAAALGQADGPDVVQVEQGREGMGALVRAGLLLPLDEAAAQHGWEERWAEGILARTRFGDDGRAWGDGTLYGVASTGEIVGGFFNYDLALQRPSRPSPTTLDQELDDWAAMRAAGQLPFVLGAADGDAVHLYGSILQAMAEPGWLSDLSYGRGGATFDTPEAVAAAAMLVEMRDRGDLSADHATATHEDALRRFRDGGGELLWTGSWDAAILATGAPSLIFTTLPPATPDGRSRALGGVGTPWAIRRGTANPGCAAAYVDFVTGDRAAQLLALNGILPSHYESGSPELGSAVFIDMASAYRETSREGTLEPRLEELFPGAREALTTGLARLLAKEISPEELVRAIEAERAAYVASFE